MNWLLPAVIVVLLLSARDGHKKGFIRKAVGIAGFFITLLLTRELSPYVADFLKLNTGIYGSIQQGFVSGDAEILEALEFLGIENAVGGFLADRIIQVLAFLVTLLAAWILVRIVSFSLGIVARLPVLHGLNKTAGLILGLAEGLLIVWIFFFVITVFASTEIGGTLLKMTAQSEVLSWLYRNNILFMFLK